MMRIHAFHFVTVVYRAIGSPIATLDGHFEFTSRVLLIIVAFIASLVLVVALVVSSRTIFEKQRVKILESSSPEPIQESPASPIQTGAPLSSHPLPPNQPSDSENSDGADKDRFACGSFKVAGWLIFIAD